MHRFSRNFPSLPLMAALAALLMNGGCSLFQSDDDAPHSKNKQDVSGVINIKNNTIGDNNRITIFQYVNAAGGPENKAEIFKLIQELDHPEIQQAKKELRILDVRDQTRFTPSNEGLAMSGEYRIQLINEGRSTWRIIGFARPVALIASAQSAMVSSSTVGTGDTPDTMVISRNLRPIESEHLDLAPGKTAWLTFKTNAPLQELVNLGDGASPPLDVNPHNIHLLAPNNGLYWRANWESGWFLNAGITATILPNP